MTEEIDLSLNITVAAAWISSWLDGLLFVIFFRFLRRLYRLRCRYHKPSVGIWSTANRIFLKIISKLTRNQRNAEENSTFYSEEILTLHPTAFIAYVFVAVISQIWLSSSQTF